MAEPDQINRLTTDHKSVRDRRPTDTLTLDTDDIMDWTGLDWQKKTKNLPKTDRMAAKSQTNRPKKDRQTDSYHVIDKPKKEG